MRCPLQMDTGAYALDILAPADRERMALHLEGCASCRSDVAEFTAMLGQLRTIALQALQDRPGKDGPVAGGGAEKLG